MGGIGGGSWKTDKLAARGKFANSMYNKNTASKFGNSNKFGFKEAPKTSNNNIKVNMETK